MQSLPYQKDECRERRRIQMKSNTIKTIWLAAIMLIIAKLAGLIDWAWLWVLSPVWLLFIFGLFLWTVVFYVMFKEMYINKNGRANRH